MMLIIGAWEGDVNSFSANIMKAVAKIIDVYGDSLNEEEFKERVGAVSVKALTRTAKERRPGSMGFAEAMIVEYNGRKKNLALRLSLNRLYSRGSSIFDGFDDETEDYSDDYSLPENDLQLKMV